MAEDAQRIDRFIAGMSVADFVGSEITVLAVERLLQRITEAAVQIVPEDAAQIGPALPVAQMRALGNRLRHEYRDIDRVVILDIAQTEVPAMAAEIDRILGNPVNHG